MLGYMRSVARAAEPHPFQRLPIAQTPARPDYGKEFKRVGKQALL